MRSFASLVSRARAIVAASTARVAATARTSAPPLIAWAKDRAVEKSTWVGLAAVASAFGKSVLADRLTSLGDVAPMIAGGLGAALLAATTSRKAA